MPVLRRKSRGTDARFFVMRWAYACLIGSMIVTHAAFAADEAFITDQKGNAITVLDLASGHIVATIKLDGHPAGIAMSRDGTHAYVTSPDSRQLSVIDTAARRVVRQIALPGGPLGVAVAPDGATVYVADWYGDTVQVIDAKSGAVRAPIKVGKSPSGLVVTPDGKMLVCADREADALSLVDLPKGAEIAVVKVGAHPFGIALDPAGTRVFAADVESDDVAVVDLVQRRLVTRIPTGRRPYVVAIAGNRGFVTNELAGTLTAFDLTSLAVVGTISVGAFPEGIEASRDGQSLYVANWMDDTVSVVGVAQLKSTAEISVGDSPRAFGTFLRQVEQGAN